MLEDARSFGYIEEGLMDPLYISMPYKTLSLKLAKLKVVSPELLKLSLNI